MKKIILSLSIILASLTQMHAQRDLSSLINRLNSVAPNSTTTIEELGKVFETFGRNNDNKTWQHDYYAAFCYLEAANYTANLDTVPILLKKANSFFDFNDRIKKQISQEAPVSTNEINCLKAYALAISLKVTKEKLAQDKIQGEITKLLNDPKAKFEPTIRSKYVEALALFNSAPNSSENKTKVAGLIKNILSSPLVEEKVTEESIKLNLPTWGKQEVDLLLRSTY